MTEASRQQQSTDITSEAAYVARASVNDQATEEDSLGFEPYVTAIAEFLTNPVTQPPLTLSIEGEWGSGKSTS
jgi:predicted KAP-like P-loop ATPase